MKNIQSIVATLALGLTFVGSVAHANSFTETANCTGCDQPPVSAGSTANPFSLELAMAAFQNGTDPTINDLAGSWTLVGVAAVPGQAVGAIDAYDANGIKNADGSSMASLQIQMGGKTGKSDFTGNPLTSPDSVTLLNLGSKSSVQGPNELTFNDREQEACFAQYTYNGTSLDKSHGNYECRLLRGNSKKMICAATLIIDPSEFSEVSANLKAQNGKVQIYVAYVKN